MKKLMSVAVAMMVGLSVTACSNSPKGDGTVATVNGQKITVSEYETTLALYKQSVEAMYGKNVWDTEVEKGVKYRDKFKENILDQMINVEVVYEQAKKDNLLPTKEEVDKKYNELKKNIDSDKEYKKDMEKIGANDEFLRTQQEQDLAVQNYKEHFDKTIKISDEEMKKYYEDHKKDYYKDEVKASHILVSTQDKNGKPLSDEKKKEAKKKAEDLLKRAKSGEEFSELAKENSDDPGSAAQGGDLGYFSKGMMVPEFEKAAFNLKPGEISDIVESSFGYHIIKVTDKVNEQTPYNDVKDSIKTILLNEKFTEQVTKLTKEAKIEKNKDALDKIKI
ncbi:MULTISPECIES: peptidylprolyl isomerase [unclassified Romboutsia]|uniref:peptidylprolyl isomerase n=1 Tax=unclassified Romboutsia TaxID=2626894 RepID=UPI00232A9162|nr:peptidylprolyl isomerase [Romboutsia sp. 1001216sp1]MDB8806018.1 peptidylprolyl isomerase [Romboutsia sp. 1001216sp1]MDB8808410.1 peptidylprolyl isomerase [Romboutsia sp. 1001216sp1]MDB8811695.1 peptidylprolyl isomerase [Romboutsia sp. 1001216sp1]MDB8817399.1 peptidylprolyl isomerase [Romboutsia sp. 1001216sp1]MDB8819979.1 peptidylprolyl isomerase [Romboutsia sp. 1001216sp1]